MELSYPNYQNLFKNHGTYTLFETVRPLRRQFLLGAAHFIPAKFLSLSKFHFCRTIHWWYLAISIKKSHQLVMRMVDVDTGDVWWSLEGDSDSTMACHPFRCLALVPDGTRSCLDADFDTQALLIAVHNFLISFLQSCLLGSPSSSFLVLGSFWILHIHLLLSCPLFLLLPWNLFGVQKGWVSLDFPSLSLQCFVKHLHTILLWKKLFSQLYLAFAKQNKTDFHNF